MKFISTRKKSPTVDFATAVLDGLAPDGGLYIPEHIPACASDVLSHSATLTLQNLGLQLVQPFLNEIPGRDLKMILEHALNFPIPLIQLEENLYVLEVFHGPTLAFKDVGARFMANILTYLIQQQNLRITILVATSGDTGSAIANAFLDMPNIDIYVLYPSKKITTLQEAQMATLGGNIHALEVTGTFDDCQLLVKTALLDESIKSTLHVTTANSINIARLLPQMIYHSWGIAQLYQLGKAQPPILSVPSGNFGNLVAAIYAHQCGLPVKQFIAATNINNIVPLYLSSGKFTPQLSRQSYSNAMDVGNPSNFERLSAAYDDSLAKMQKDILGISISDEKTLAEIASTYKQDKYLLDPHTAVGTAAARQYQKNNKTKNIPIIVTATAHPAKFADVMERALQMEIPLPASLQQALARKKQSVMIKPDYQDFKTLLLRNAKV